MDIRFGSVNDSFMILQTNPKLTTNVKINVDTNYNIFLESFDANTTLSSIKFKKYVVNPNSDYSRDLYNFYDSGKILNKFSFDVYKNKTDYNIEKDFSNQFDNFYVSGAKFISSKLYTENIEYLATLYINENIPSYFTIFKIEKSTHESLTDIFKESTVVKTFDLTSKSNIGKYIRKHYDKISGSESLVINSNPG